MEDRHSEFDAAQSYPPPPQPGAFNCDAAAYQAGYARSIADPDAYWGEQARATLDWFRDFKEVRGGSFKDGDVRWFAEGQLNVCYNCVDRAFGWGGRGGRVRAAQCVCVCVGGGVCCTPLLRLPCHTAPHTNSPHPRFPRCAHPHPRGRLDPH